MEKETKEIPITKEEILKVAGQEGAAKNILSWLGKLIDNYPAPRIFLEASDADYRRKFPRYGKGMQSVVKAVKEKCYFILENEEARMMLDERVEKFLERRMDELNPVFSENDLQNVTLFMSQSNAKVIDLVHFNKFVLTFDRSVRSKLELRYWQERKWRKEAEERLDEEVKRRQAAVAALKDIVQTPEEKEREKNDTEGKGSGERR